VTLVFLLFGLIMVGTSAGILVLALGQRNKRGFGIIVVDACLFLAAGALAFIAAVNEDRRGYLSGGIALLLLVQASLFYLAKHFARDS
jgi:hypothetical protein